MKVGRVSMGAKGRELRSKVNREEGNLKLKRRLTVNEQEKAQVTRCGAPQRETDRGVDKIKGGKSPIERK